MIALYTQKPPATDNNLLRMMQANISPHTKRTTLFNAAPTLAPAHQKLLTIYDTYTPTYKQQVVDYVAQYGYPNHLPTMQELEQYQPFSSTYGPVAISCLLGQLDDTHAMLALLNIIENDHSQQDSSWLFTAFVSLLSQFQWGKTLLKKLTNISTLPVAIKTRLLATPPQYRTAIETINKMTTTTDTPPSMTMRLQNSMTSMLQSASQYTHLYELLPQWHDLDDNQIKSLATLGTCYLNVTTSTQNNSHEQKNIEATAQFIHIASLSEQQRQTLRDIKAWTINSQGIAPTIEYNSQQLSHPQRIALANELNEYKIGAQYPELTHYKTANETLQNQDTPADIETTQLAINRLAKYPLPQCPHLLFLGGYPPLMPPPSLMHSS
jgi:hypothetical protein